MRTIVCPECGGDGYTERIDKFTNAWCDRKPCEKCGGEGKAEDSSSAAMLEIANNIVEFFEEMDDYYDEDFDDGYVTRELLNDMGSALYELQSQLKARCK